MNKPKKTPREKDLTSRYFSGKMDEDRMESQERFTDRSKHAQQNKMEKTTAQRLAAETDESLPTGQVIQVHSLFYEVKQDDVVYLCVARKTLQKVAKTAIVVGDYVRFRNTTQRAAVEFVGGPKSTVQPTEGVIEAVLPRKTVLTRTDSFKAIVQHPIVANAEQMLIVVSLQNPAVKWGLVDRMIVAAKSGGLLPIVCLNKIDLASAPEADPADLVEAEEVLNHYLSMGVAVVRTSAEASLGLDELRECLRDRITVLAGHSGVGKSSLIHSIQPHLDLRVAEVSEFTQKGRHTTTSARRYPLDFGGAVIDTPGVKLFGLWGVTRENLDEFFPDVAAEIVPQWRKESYERIAASLPKE